MNFYEIFPKETADDLTQKHTNLKNFVATYAPTKYTQDEFDAFIRMFIREHYEFASAFVNANLAKKLNDEIENSNGI